MRSLLFTLLCLFAQTVIGQDNPGDFNRLGILVGGQQTNMLDLQFSPLVHRANEISLKLFYEARHQQSNWNAALGMSTGSLFPAQYADRMLYNTTEDIDGVITTDSFIVRGNTRTLNLQFGYAYDLVQSKQWNFNVGGAVRDQLMYPTSFTNMGILNAASLLATVQATYHPDDRNQLSLALNMPVLGFNSRFPYSGTVSLPNQTLLEAFFDGGTHFVSVNKYVQTNVNCTWRYALSVKTNISLQYDFMWQRYAIPVPLKQYAQSIGASFELNF
jgi:hypothetical protein